MFGPHCFKMESEYKDEQKELVTAWPRKKPCKVFGVEKINSAGASPKYFQTRRKTKDEHVLDGNKGKPSRGRQNKSHLA
ncbi:hypothetical protein PsorP6_011865 [Peronosclerospora sorghi]|uniref:Uncharacterized protein n=1 Tax=Peronosclerospora sorghi TaxID=230839 RepID=A0ACC0WJR0_9STRA|nr:hypothetical protein PsorP6_011865 [Peronosclerospora sorghi]